MNILIDLLGAVIVATVLLLMMITFQYQLLDIANRTIFTSQMIAHEEKACVDFNRVIAMAGVGVDPDSVVVQADANAVSLRTRWNYTTNTLMVSPQNLELSLLAATTFGKQIRLAEGGTVIKDLGYILWLEDLTFAYYDGSDAVVSIPTTATSRATIRSMDIDMTFRRDPPRINATPLRTKVQLKVYFMNCYLQGG